MPAYGYLAEDSIGPIRANETKPIFAVGGGAQRKRNAYTLFGEIASVFPWNEAKINGGNYGYDFKITGVTLGGKEETYTYSFTVNYGTKVNNDFVSVAGVIPQHVYPFAHSLIGMDIGVLPGWYVRPALTAFTLPFAIFTKLWVWVLNGNEQMTEFRYKLVILRMS